MAAQFKYSDLVVDSKHTQLESLAVELIRNIASGRYFILLEDEPGSTNFIVITTMGKVRPIERRLFGLPDIVDQKTSLRRCNLTELQLKKYGEYFDD